MTYYFLENGASTKRNHLKINFITGSNNLYFFYIILNKFQRTFYIFETSLTFYFERRDKEKNVISNHKNKFIFNREFIINPVYASIERFYFTEFYIRIDRYTQPLLYISSQFNYSHKRVIKYIFIYIFNTTLIQSSRIII